MKMSEKGERLMESARRRVLHALASGDALPVARLPKRWPETRVLIRHVLDELARNGDVRAEARMSGPPAWRITEQGRTRLRGSGPADG